MTGPINCPPGEHAVAFYARGFRFPICEYDVPGNGLPMDTPTLVSLIVCGTVMLAVILYLLWLMWRDGKIA